MRGMKRWCSEMEKNKHKYWVVFVFAEAGKRENIFSVTLDYRSTLARHRYEEVSLIEVTLSFLTAALSSTAPKFLAHWQATAHARSPSAPLQHR